MHVESRPEINVSNAQEQDQEGGEQVQQQEPHQANGATLMNVGTQNTRPSRRQEQHSRLAAAWQSTHACGMQPAQANMQQ